MSLRGTSSYIETGDVPPRVAAAVGAARSHGFDKSCRPAHGKLLAVLAAGVGPGRIGETGTGCGVGLAWLASGAAPEAAIISVELDQQRAAIASDLFADDPRVTVLTDDWTALQAHAPFDLLILDGGGQGKRPGEPPIEPDQWLKPGGLLVMDDFTPSSDWPPTHDGKTDEPRLFWLQHPSLLTTEIRTEPDCATVIAMRRPGGH